MGPRYDSTEGGGEHGSPNWPVKEVLEVDVEAQVPADAYRTFHQEVWAMIYQTRRRFGDRVNAIINTDPTFGPNSFSVWGLGSREGERSASGLAVHLLTAPAPPPSADH